MNKKKIIIITSISVLLIGFIVILIMFLSKYNIHMIDENLIMSYGEVYQLKYRGNYDHLTWKSSNPDLIKISS